MRRAVKKKSSRKAKKKVSRKNIISKKRKTVKKAVKRKVMKKKAKKKAVKRMTRKTIKKKMVKKKTAKKKAAKKKISKKKALKKKRVKKAIKKKTTEKRVVKKKVAKAPVKAAKDIILEGNIVDVTNRKIFPGRVAIKDGKIISIEKTQEIYDRFLLPGLVDAHIHIESTTLVPSRFAQTVAPHGTVATVSDPHEIANVLGVRGINYMIREAKKTPLKIYYTAPSCVPTTEFETAGAKLTADDIDMLLKVPRIVALGEMMNYPGVINKDKDVLAKIKVARQNKKPIDGHCPSLTGEDLKKYVAAGISTEHECSDAQEAAEKARLSMKIMIKESSAKKYMEKLVSVARNPRVTCFLVSDYKDPDDLVEGHMDLLLRKIVRLGIDPMRAVQMATINPVEHYHLGVGLLRKDDPADIVVIDNLDDFKVLETWIDGKLVAKAGRSLFNVKPESLANSMKLDDKSASDFKIKNYSSNERQIVRVIRADPDELITQQLHASLPVRDNEVLPEPGKDVLKIAVVERYGKNRIGLGFVNGFGLKQGAIASSMAHDSHNIIVVGTNDDDMAKAVNEIKKMGGGSIVVNDKKILAKIALPVAGLMSTKTGLQMSQEVEKLREEVRKLGCVMPHPFMTLSFMALLVIPKLKISDRGLFDGENFKFTSLFVEHMSPF